MSPARARENSEEEPDRVAGQPHPRETYELFGQEQALARAARALRSGRPPQAWLLAGPPGVGKATLAYRIARYLLRYGATAEGPTDLALPASDSVSRRIEAQAHPGLLVLKRQLNERGKLKTVLDVDEVRRLAGFFGMTAESGGWRVAIVDSADEMNDNAANALLKILEEPPPRGLLMLLSHAPGRLLPTIRSRTQRLDLRPLDNETLTSALKQMLRDEGDKERAQLVQLSEGSLGLALHLSSGEGLRLAAEADALLSVRGNPDYLALSALAERIARGTDMLENFGEFLIQAIARRIRERALQNQADERATALWEQIASVFERATGLHLDPRQTVLSVARDIADARRRGAL